MIRACLLAGLFCCTLPCGPAVAGEAKFTSGPTVTRDGEKVTLRFAVSAPTDVAVYVEGGNGQIVRHLAAGVLGRNPPAPLQADTLTQSIVWDGKDDDGRPAAGPFTVRVGLGLKADHAGVAFADADKTGPNRIEAVLGLAVLADGPLVRLDLRQRGQVRPPGRGHLVRRQAGVPRRFRRLEGDRHQQRVRPADDRRLSDRDDR